MLSRLHSPVAAAGQMVSSIRLSVCWEMLMLRGSGDGDHSGT